MLLSIALSAFGCAAGCTPERSPITPEELQNACPSAARAMVVDCPAIAVAHCGMAASMAECPARDLVETECDSRIDEELAKCR